MTARSESDARDRFDAFAWVRICFIAAFVSYFIVRPSLVLANERMLLSLGFASSAAWLVYRSISHGRIQSRRTAVWIVILPLAGVVVSVMFSEQTRLAVESAAPWLAVIGAAAFVVAGGVSRFEVVSGLILAASVISALLLWRFGEATLLWARTLGAVDPSAGILDRLPVTLPRAEAGSHPNVSAMLLEVALVLSAGWAMAADGFRRWIASAAILLTALGLVTTGSRSGVLAVGAGVAVFLSVKAATRTDDARVRRWLITAFSAMLVVVVALTAVFAAGYRPAFLFRGTLSARLPVWEAAWSMFLEHPVFGNGPGSFSWMVDDHLFVYPGTIPRLVWSHAHNAYLQVLVETGALGAVLFAASIGLATAAFLRRGRAERNADAAIVGSLAALSVHGLFDLVPNGVAIAIVVGLLIGVVARGHDAAGSHVGLNFALGGASVCLLLPIVFLWGHSAATAYERGVFEVSRGAWREAVLWFDDAWSKDALPVYENTARLASLRAGLESTPRLFDPGAVRFPLDGSAALNEALLWVGADRRMAVDLVQNLIPVVDSDEVALTFTGFLFEELDRPQLADDVWRKAFRIEPALASARIWNEAGLQGRIDSIVRSIVSADTCGSPPALVLDQAVAEDVLDGIVERCSSGPALWVSLLRLKRSDELDSRLQEVVRRTPDDPVARRLAGLAALQSGRVVEGRTDLAVAALLGDLDAALELRQSYPESEVPRLIVDLAESLEERRVPVRELRDDGGSVYVLAATRLAVVDQRPPVPNPLLWDRLGSLLPEEAADIIAP